MKLRNVGALAALAVAAGASNASLVTNGSFESGLAGWGCVAPAGGCFTGTQGPPAVDGANYFYGFDNGSGGDLTQTLATSVGATYTLSLIFNTNGTVPPNALTVDVGDLSTPLALVQGVWTTFAGSFTASSTSTVLDFHFQTAGGTGTVWIDSVAVGAVPTPPAALLVGLGLVGLAATRRVQRR